jgi:hypothetical protein
MDDRNKPTHTSHHGHDHGHAHGHTASTRGGTPEQHAAAGRKGGLAPHTCRGRGCSKKSSE